MQSTAGIRMRVAIVALAVLIAGCSPSGEKSDPAAGMATATATLRPGQWRTTAEIVDYSVIGVSAAVRAQTREATSRLPPVITVDCVTSADVRDFAAKRAKHAAGCPVHRINARNRQVDGETTCKAKAITHTVKMRGAYGPERVEMTLDWTVSGSKGGAIQTQNMQLLSERVGDCPG
jgi:hypothetical protein